MKDLKKLFKKFSLVAAGLVLTGAIPAHSAEPVIWRLGHTLSVPGTLYEKIITEEMPQRIAKASEGIIQIRPLIGVISTSDVINALRRDRVEMGTVTVGYTAATYPLWAVLNLPGLVNDGELLGHVSREIVMPEMAKDMKEMGIRPVTSVSWDGGAYFSNKEVRSVNDFSGLRWRTHAPMLSQLIVELGSSTVGMPYAELQPSLERKLVDAYTSTVPAMNASGLAEVTKYAILAPQGTSLTMVMVTEKALEALPNDLRNKVIAEFDAINREIPKRLHQEFIDGIEKAKSSGVEVIKFSDEESEKVTIAAKKAVWEEWLEQTGPRGKELLERVQAYKK
ncbi:TRAP transporter substrate-binding protein DctP [Alcaligenaceae bacterium]|nr:TRAP transporter substrate-binding protein DctP [Alcaligenaceae bacterium]